MWFLANAETQDEAFDVELMTEKILVNNLECYVAVFGSGFSQLTDSRKEEAIGKIISFYYQFSMFIIIDRFLKKDVRDLILKTLGKYGEEFKQLYEFETYEFLDKSKYILGKYIPRLFGTSLKIFKDIQPLNKEYFKKLYILKEERMEIKELVKKHMKGSISYLLLKDGKVVDKKNIALDETALKGFVFSTRLPLVLSNAFIGNHSNLKGKTPRKISLIGGKDEKSLLIKTFLDGHNLFLLCAEGEVPMAEKVLEELSKEN